MAGHHPAVTIGNDAGTAEAIEKMGGKHLTCEVDEIVSDAANKIASTPADMLGPTIAQVAKGIEKCAEAVLNMWGMAQSAKSMAHSVIVSSAMRLALCAMR